MLRPLYLAVTKKVPGKKSATIWKEQNLDQDYARAKTLLTTATNLVYPDPNNPLALTCDASKVGVGAVLEELQNGHWVPIGFWSKMLSETQQRRLTFRRELYSIWQAIRHFIQEIDGRHITIWTDHRPILGAFNGNTLQHDPIAQHQIQEIGMWTSDVRYLPGKLNTVADILSRPSHDKLGAAYKMDTEIGSVQNGAELKIEPVAREIQTEGGPAGENFNALVELVDFRCCGS